MMAGILDVASVISAHTSIEEQIAWFEKKGLPVNLQRIYEYTMICIILPNSSQYTGGYIMNKFPLHQGGVQ